MDAGKLTHQITIQKMVPTQDTTGAEVPNWATHATMWAWIQPLNGMEKYINQQVLATLTHQITIRYTAGVTPKMRVMFGSRYFDITQVLNREERNIEIKLLCKEMA